MDDVLLEVRRAREAYAQEFDYDLTRLHRDLKEQEKASGRRVVSLTPRQPKRPGKAESATAPPAGPPQPPLDELLRGVTDENRPSEW